MIGHGVVVGAEGHGDRDPVARGGGNVDMRRGRRPCARHLEVRGRGEHPLVVGLEPATVAATPSSRSISSASVRTRPSSFQRISKPGLGQRRPGARGARQRTGVAHRTAPGHAGATGRSSRTERLDAHRVRAPRETRSQWADSRCACERGVAREHLVEHQRARLVLGGHQLEAQAVAARRPGCCGRAAGPARATPRGAPDRSAARR